MTNLKNIMTRAWAIAKEAVANFGGKASEYIAEAMKMAWAEVKEVRYTVEDLIAMGAKRWEKAGYDRLYLNKAGLRFAGLEISRYNTGNVSLAKLNGEKVSNAKGSRMASIVERAYIDLTTGKLHCTQAKDDDVQQAVIALENNLKLA